MPVSANPLVTVIISNYNHRDTLPECIAAIQRQRYSPLEVIMVDDCSVDDSVQVATSAGVRVVQTAVNGGVAVARNLGAAKAAGEVLFFVDADVALAPESIANAVTLLISDPNIAAVGGVEDPEPLRPGSRINDYRALQYHHWSRTAEGEVSILWGEMCAVRRAVFEEIGPFNPRLRQTEEVDYGHRLSQRYSVRLTSTVHGRQDYDHRLLPMLRKLFNRGRLRVPLYVRKRRFARGYETASRALGSVVALLALATLPLLLAPMYAVVPVLFFVIWFVSDAGLYRLAIRRRGPAFAGFTLAVHFLVCVVIAVSVAVGALQWLASPAFRRLYDEPATAG